MLGEVGDDPVDHAQPGVGRDVVPQDLRSAFVEYSMSTMTRSACRGRGSIALNPLIILPGTALFDR
jgi:hypothetical protein